MVTVEEYGKDRVFDCRCDNCKSKLNFMLVDVEKHEFKFREDCDRTYICDAIKCPDCGSYVKISGTMYW